MPAQDTPRNASRTRFVVALSTVWIAVIGIASAAGLVGRPAYAEVDPTFGVFSFVVCGVLFAFIVAHLIRNRLLAWMTVIVAAVWTGFECYATLRDTSSTAAVGVIWAPYICVVVFVVALALDWTLRLVRRASVHVR
jgi:hypothetical protein